MSISHSVAGAYNAASVTPSDSTMVNCRALYVGTAGNVAVTMAGDGTGVTFANVPAGSFLPVQVQKVMSTNTTASNIIALF